MVCICAYKLFFVIGMVLLNKNQKRLKGSGADAVCVRLFIRQRIQGAVAAGRSRRPRSPRPSRHGVIQYINKNGADAE